MWSPRDVEQIIASFGLIIILRLGHKVSEAALDWLKAVPQFEQNVAVLEMSAELVSSTAIREKLRNGLCVNGLTTKGVIEYITAHRLYSSSQQSA